MRRDVRELVEQAVRQGWRVEERKSGRMTSERERWSVTVETFEGFTSSTDVLERVGAGLDANPIALAAAASLDRETGALSATMTVDATSQSVATELAIDAFYEALARAGFDVERPGWSLKLEIEPCADEAIPA
jgi:hypothetical protein